MKNENITVEQARELVGDQLLWPRVRDFLWNFVPQIHESWLKEFKRGELAFATLKSERQAQKFILSSLGVEPCFYDFPKDNFSRFLLLDSSTVEEIAKWLGALACAGDLRKVTNGADVRALKTAFPGIYPEVFSYTMYFREWGKGKDALLPSDGPKSANVARVGYSIVNAALSDLPKPLLKRFWLKMDKGIYENLRAAGNALSAAPANISSNMHLLLKLRFPEAHKICCL